MTALFWQLLGWREAVCTFDAAQYGAALQALQQAGLACRTKTTSLSSASRRTGMFYAVGERADRSIEYQIFVRKGELPRAQLVLQGRQDAL